MATRKYFNFKPTIELIVVIGAMTLCWLFNHLADGFRGHWSFYLFYEGLFALGVCIILPVFYNTVIKKRSLKLMGITRNKWKKAVFFGLIISMFLTIGRIKGMDISNLKELNLVPIVIGMMFSTLFEEVFFRGFLQTRFEAFFGIIPAILLSGLCFALYHSAQKFIGFEVQELITLYIVGIIFSISYRITGSIITSYIVNLPQAILTFIGEPNYVEYGKNITYVSAIVCSVGIVIAICFMIILNRNTEQKNGGLK